MNPNDKELLDLLSFCSAADAFDDDRTCHACGLDSRDCQCRSCSICGIVGIPLWNGQCEHCTLQEDQKRWASEPL